MLCGSWVRGLRFLQHQPTERVSQSLHRLRKRRHPARLVCVGRQCTVDDDVGPIIGIKSSTNCWPTTNRETGFVKAATALAYFSSSNVFKLEILASDSSSATNGPLSLKVFVGLELSLHRISEQTWISQMCRSLGRHRKKRNHSDAHWAK